MLISPVMESDDVQEKNLGIIAMFAVEGLAIF